MAFESRRLLTIALAIGVTPLAFSQSPALTPSHFVEALQRDLPVEGNVFWGAHAGPGDGIVDFDAIRLTIPAGDHSRLCIFAKTQNGGYRAEAFYLLGQVAHTVAYSVRFPTGHRSELRGHSIRDFGMRAYVTRDDCVTGNQKERIYLPVQWSANQGSSGEYLLLMNSQTPGTRITVFNPGTRVSSDCSLDEQSQSRPVFDTECPIRTTPQQHLVELTITRQRFSNQASSALKFYFP